eukprot:SAG11_NODE_37206_length_258_cov_0.635220_1_plen_78_part_01
MTNSPHLDDWRLQSRTAHATPPSPMAATTNCDIDAQSIPPQKRAHTDSWCPMKPTFVGRSDRCGVSQLPFVEPSRRQC